MSAELWVAVLVLALVDTLSPTTLAVTIGVLLAGGPLVRRMIIYLTTLAACYFAFGASLMLGLGLALDADRLMDPELDPWFFAAGVVLVALSFLIDPGTKAAKQERRRRAAERAAARRAGQSERIGRGGALPMVGLGMTTFGLEFVTVVPYLAAIGLLTTSEVAVAQWVPALLAYNIIMVTPSLMLLGATLLARGRMRDRYIHWGERLDAATRPAAAWVVGGVGGILILQTVGTSLRAG